MSEADRTFGFMLDTGEEQLMDIGEVKTFNKNQITVSFVKKKQLKILILRFPLVASFL